MSTASPFRRALFAAAFVFAPLATTNAQTLSAGTRVRVKSPSLVAPITGNYQGMRRDTLVLIEDDVSAKVWNFTTSSIETLEVSDGMRRGNRKHMVRWGTWGTLGGAGIGWLLAATLEAGGDAEYNDAASAAVGAVLGAGLGVAYGYRIVEERWNSVPIPGRVGVLPMRGGVRVSYSASF